MFSNVPAKCSLAIRKSPSLDGVHGRSKSETVGGCFQNRTQYTLHLRF